MKEIKPIDVFNEKIKSIRFALPQYSELLRELQDSCMDAVLYEKNISRQYWEDTFAGRKRYLRFNETPNGKAYLLKTELVDITPDTTVTFISNG